MEGVFHDLVEGGFRVFKYPYVRTFTFFVRPISLKLARRVVHQLYIVPIAELRYL